MSTILAGFQASRAGTLATLDDPATLAAATMDPRRFVDFGERPRIIDEVQRGGDRLLTSIKAVVDSPPGPSQFVLAGSTNFLSTRAINESLAGRATYLDGAFLTMTVPAWTPAFPTQPTRTSRSYVADVGLAAHITGATTIDLGVPGAASLGPLIETFAVTELTRLLANDPAAPRLRYYRDRTGREMFAT